MAKKKSSKTTKKKSSRDNTVFITNKVFIPADLTSAHALDEHYRKDLFNENSCAKCDNLPERLNDLCLNCPAYLGSIKSWAEKEVKGRDYYTVPCGNLKKVVRLLELENATIVDKRKQYSFTHKIKFTGTLYTGDIVNGNKTADQVKIVDQWMKKKNGMIEAAPRSGKCVTGDTIITTSFGKHRIDQLIDCFNLQEGIEEDIDNDLEVLTAYGRHKVNGLFWQTVPSVVKFTLEDGKTLTGTSNHKVACIGNEGPHDFIWVELKDLTMEHFVILPDPIPFMSDHLSYGLTYHRGKVESIEHINEPTKVYDLSVPNTRSYITNGMVSHNTVIGTYISCALGQKTLIIANQEDLLKNFYKTFVGDKTIGLKARTNVPKLRKKTGKTIVGIVDNLQQCLDDDLDVAMITYQKFLRPKGKKLIKEFNKKYSVLVLDEAHGIGAECYADFVSRLTMKHRLPLSATPDRKDNRHVLVHDHMGPIVARSTTTALVPEIHLWETGIKHKTGLTLKHWTYFTNYLANSNDRNVQIVQQVFRDLKAGHKAIIIPVSTKKHMATLTAMINKQAKIGNKKRNEGWPKELAIEFEGKTKNRSEKLAAIDSGKHRVVVAIYSLFKQGIDLHATSAIYISTPTSNPAMAYQLVNRVCTPYPNKKQPVVRWMIDDFPQSVGCFRSIFWNEISKKLKDTKDNTKRYAFAEDNLERAFAISKNRRSYTPDLEFNNVAKKEKVITKKKDDFSRDLPDENNLSKRSKSKKTPVKRKGFLGMNF